MKIQTKKVILPATIFIMILVAYLGSGVSLNTQSDFLSFLMFPAAATFSVTGVWLAVVFPEVLHGIYETDDIDQKEEIIARGKYLLIPLMVSVLAEISIIGYKLFIVIANDFPSMLPLNIQQSLSLFFVLSITAAVIYSLICSVSPGINILFKARFHTRMARAKKRFRGKRS
jgi:hypothetical protein